MGQYFQVCKIATALLCCLSSSVFAGGVTITGTRIIFPANQQVSTVQLNNTLDQPAMIQAWLDNGNPKEIPEASEIPFILTPPLSRIEAKKGQMIRLIAKDTTALPVDRESVYWFNILDIPATEQSSDVESSNMLQISIRSRIKVFYRPEKLKMSQQKAFTAVGFKYDTANKAILINNPSPYYLSFEQVSLKKGKEKYAYTEPLMVAPFSTETINPKLEFRPSQVTYSLINDYGGSAEFTANLDDVSSVPVEAIAAEG